MKLIDKDALVAEIEKAIKNIYAGREYVGIPYDEECIVMGIQKVKDIIDTLETKEVDLDFTEEVDVWVRDNGDTNGFFNVEELAKHFFELGLRASNPLTYEDIEMIGKLRLKVALDLRNKELESSINNPIKFTENDFCKEVLKRFKAQKGEKV